MAKKTGTGYTLEEGDTIPYIARINKDADGGRQIWADNANLPGGNIANNPMVIPAGVTVVVQPPAQQQQGANVTRTNDFKIPTPQLDLFLTVLDSNGKPLVGKIRKKGWRFQFVTSGRIYDQTIKTDSSGGVLIPDVEANVKEGTLKIVNVNDTAREEKIELKIGSLWPIVPPVGLQGYSREKAVQKMLTNLGYYQGDIDGNLDGEATRAALRTFQKENDLTVDGLANAPTCQALVTIQKNKMPRVDAPEQPTRIPSKRTVLTDAGGTEASWRSSVLKGGRSFSPFGKDKTSYDSGNFKTNYVEPTTGKLEGSVYKSARSADRTGLAKRMPLFPPKAYVAPCYPKEQADNPNVVMMRSRRFVFLDIGRWLQAGRDFGLIWGSHVYLCEYHGTNNTDVQPASYHPGGAERLDSCFFQAMGASVTVKQYASAYWAADSDFDWDKLYVFLPDLHLITGDKQRIWWLNYQKLQPEIDLLEFANKLSKLDLTVKSRTTVMQTGDSYDLMIGLGLGPDGTDPLFVVNDREEVELLPDTEQYDGKTPVELLATWIREIQGMGWVDMVYSSERKEKAPNEPDLDPANPDIPGLNPAERAFRVLNRTFKADNPGSANADARMIYLYGNHDNYLILPAVCQAAQIPLRRPFFQGKGLFVEHGHRMEASFGLPGQYHPKAHGLAGRDDPRNHDGVDGGFKTACDAFVQKQRGGFGKWKIKKGQPMATAFALAHDQTHYIREAANIWLGREAVADATLPPPHIYVIGHTHNPNLFYIEVDDSDMEVAE